jgi:integrase
MKLTAATIRTLTLPAGKTEVLVFDDALPGFGVRLRLGGSRTFVYQYKFGPRQRRLTLGSVAALDIGRARETAKDLYARVRLGEDPAGDKADAKVKASETFEAVAKRFLDYKRERLRPSSYPETERHLLKHARLLHPIQLEKITRRDIATVIGAVRGLPTGNRVRSSLSSLFSWAMAQGLLEANPVSGTLKNDERSRERVLSPAELRLIWNNLEDDHYGAIIKLLALTGSRADEIAALRWSEVNLAEGTINLPAERTKNHRPHALPLSAPARNSWGAAPAHELFHRPAPRSHIRGRGGGFLRVVKVKK